MGSHSDSDSEYLDYLKEIKEKIKGRKIARHKLPFLLEVHILLCAAAERKRVFAFENIQSGFEVTDVLLVAICYLSFL